jgi:hypothetical protein
VTGISAKEFAICISKKLIMQYQAALSWFFAVACIGFSKLLNVPLILKFPAAAQPQL